MIFPFFKMVLQKTFSLLRQGSQSCFDSDQVKNMGVACFPQIFIHTNTFQSYFLQNNCSSVYLPLHIARLLQYIPEGLPDLQRAMYDPIT